MLVSLTAEFAQVLILSKRVTRLATSSIGRAATAAVTKRSFTADFVKMTVDKPFLFALRDQTSGLILLAGYVGDPTGGSPQRRIQAELLVSELKHWIPANRHRRARAVSAFVRLDVDGSGESHGELLGFGLRAGTSDHRKCWAVSRLA
jgi:hypothetical protein